MSDYTNKRAVFETMSDVFNSYGNNALNFDEEETKAIKRFCAMLQSQIELLPTLDEKEIIRKAFERILERLEEITIGGDCRHKCNKYDWTVGACIGECVDYVRSRAIEIVKEECGINE